jgi:hypothetical protein
MATTFACDNQQRHQLVGLHPVVNGIDYLEVLHHDAPPGSPEQQTLLVHCFKPIPLLTANNVRLVGGVRITDVQVVWAHRANALPAGLVPPAEQAFYSGLPNPNRILVVRTDQPGDFSDYELFIRASAGSDNPPANFDLILSQIHFNFKVECPTDLDCEPVDECPPETLPSPRINYLAKDYASFRQLMLDRLAVTMPDWTERNPVDFGIAMVELMAYAGDYLSYYQDAVGTEAYLDTARQRASVRRHAKLLDYHMHEGVNSRAWVHLAVTSLSDADGFPLPAGTTLLTEVNAERGSMAPASFGTTLTADAQVYETMHSVTLRATHNQIDFYTWGDDRCCLPRGATRATLLGSTADLQLAEGDLLLFEEVVGPDTGEPGDADTSHRHVVRLCAEPQERVDTLTNDTVLEIAWDIEDALPFPLCVGPVPDGEGGLRPIAVARGNIVLADAGQTVTGRSPLPALAPASGGFRPLLPDAGITFGVPFDPVAARSAPASKALSQDPREALPAIRLTDEDENWLPQPDLLDSDPFDAHFVAEIDDERRVTVRFGDGALGKKPTPGNTFTATYRLGNGRATHVGAESLAHVVTTLTGITNVRNPMPSAGGIDPESTKEVKLYAPQAFRIQERAVTPADYAAMAERHAEVAKAQATLRWTGSWHTMFVTIDRRAGRPVDADFEEEIQNHLERFRLAGHDVEIEPPIFVPLDIALRVCVDPDVFRNDILLALMDVFSSGVRRNGRLGFFHPDNFTFGQTVFLSRIIATAMDVPGVNWVEPQRFQRWGKTPNGELEASRMTMARLEIARLDNDPSRPENGRIAFKMEGGL